MFRKIKRTDKWDIERTEYAKKNFFLLRRLERMNDNDDLFNDFSKKEKFTSEEQYLLKYLIKQAIRMKINLYQRELHLPREEYTKKYDELFNPSIINQRKNNKKEKEKMKENV